MKLITGLLEPTTGKIRFEGSELTPKTIKKVRRKVGYTFQDPDNQLFMPSAFEDVAFAARQKGLCEQDIQIIVSKALDEVEAQHLAEKASYNMSGGEKRLITLASVLASEPEVLMLDEPSVGLDPRSRRMLIKLLERRNETKIIATHDMDLALELCDRVIVLHNGEIRADDTPAGIFEDSILLNKNHLEVPLCMQGCIRYGNQDRVKG
jgi:cobalt/nickel transport system ATP-binding protein